MHIFNFSDTAEYKPCCEQNSAQNQHSKAFWSDCMIKSCTDKQTRPSQNSIKNNVYNFKAAACNRVHKNTNKTNCSCNTKNNQRIKPRNYTLRNSCVRINHQSAGNNKKNAYAAKSLKNFFCRRICKRMMQNRHNVIKNHYSAK